MDEVAGGEVARDLVQAAALAPVSHVPQGDGSYVHFAHLVERGRTGLIAVTERGRRFTNEADSYHDFMQVLLRASAASGAPQARLVCDRAFIRRYGVGAIKPFPSPIGRWLCNGYLQRAQTIEQLATICGIDPQAFRQTVDV